MVADPEAIAGGFLDDEYRRAAAFAAGAVGTTGDFAGDFGGHAKIGARDEVAGVLVDREGEAASFLNAGEAGGAFFRRGLEELLFDLAAELADAFAGGGVEERFEAGAGLLEEEEQAEARKEDEVDREGDADLYAETVAHYSAFMWRRLAARWWSCWKSWQVYRKFP